MRDAIAELLDPSTDRAVLIQVGVILTTWLIAGLAVRRNRDLLHFVTGLALMALAWRGLRAAH